MGTSPTAKLNSQGGLSSLYSYNSIIHALFMNLHTSLNHTLMLGGVWLSLFLKSDVSLICVVVIVYKLLKYSDEKLISSERLKKC